MRQIAQLEQNVQNYHYDSAASEGVAKGASQGALLNEFSAILDKIASKVSNLNTSQQDLILNYTPVFESPREQREAQETDCTDLDSTDMEVVEFSNEKTDEVIENCEVEEGCQTEEEEIEADLESEQEEEEVALDLVQVDVVEEILETQEVNPNLEVVVSAENSGKLVDSENAANFSPMSVNHSASNEANSEIDLSQVTESQIVQSANSQAGEQQAKSWQNNTSQPKLEEQVFEQLASQTTDINTPQQEVVDPARHIQVARINPNVTENETAVNLLDNTTTSTLGLNLTTPATPVAPGVEREAFLSTMLKNQGNISTTIKADNNISLTTKNLTSPTNSKDSQAEASQDKPEAKQLSKSQTSRTLEKVENALKEIAKSKDGKTISVRLDPPQLGSVRIDVTYRDSALHARVVAESPQINNLLRERASELQSVLRQVGLDAESVSVSVGSDSDFQQSLLNGSNQFNNKNERQNSGFQMQGSNGSGLGLKGKVSANQYADLKDGYWVA